MTTISFAPLDAQAVAYLSRQIGIDYSHCDFSGPNWLCVTGRDDGGQIAGVIACEFKEWFDVHFSAAVDPRRLPRSIRERVLVAVFTTLFSSAVRVTALIAPENRVAISAARRMGFLYEGYMRLGVEGRRDAMLFGMLKHECRYLDYEPRHRAPVPRVDIGGFHGQRA